MSQSALPAFRQLLATATPTAIAFGSERFNIAHLHDAATNPSRMTAPIAGLYEISGGIDWAGNPTGERTTALMVNNTTVIARQRDSADTAPGRHAQNVSTLYALSPGDYLELVGTQTSGGSLDAVNFPTTYLAMRWVAPAP